MVPLAELLARAHLPLTALALVAGLGVSAASRDLMKRVLGAGLALLAAVAHRAAAPGADGAALGGVVLLVSGVALGLVLVVRIRETFGGMDVRRIRDGLDEDSARAEREGMNALATFIITHGIDALTLAPLTIGAILTVLPGGRIVAILAAMTALAMAGLAAGVIARGGEATDPLGSGALALVGLTGAVAFIAAGPVLAREIEGRVQGIALGLGLMALGLAFAVASTADVEMLALALAGGAILCAAITALGVTRARAAAAAALSALLVALGAGALAWLGADLLAGASTDLGDIAAALHPTDGLAGIVGLVLLAIACAAVAGLAPLHGWAADVAQHTLHGLAPVVMIIARVAAFTGLIRIWSLAQAEPLSSVALAFSWGGAALGATGVVAGSLQAVGARDARRLAAHALTAQFGCALIGLAAGGVDGAIAALFVIGAGAMTALALVVGAAAARPQLGAAAPMGALDGLANGAPFIAAAVGVAAFGLTGAPLTAAFLGKWLSVEAVLARGWYWAAGLIVAASFAAVFVAGQIIERMYFRERSAQIGPAPAGALVFAPALIAAAAATLVFGWNGAGPLDAARLAARAMTGAP